MSKESSKWGSSPTPVNSRPDVTRHALTLSSAYLTLLVDKNVGRNAVASLSDVWGQLYDKVSSLVIT